MQKEQVRFEAQSDSSIFPDTMVDMSWTRIQECADKNYIVLFPVGIIEAHGPHLDLSVDIMLAHIYCRFLKQKLSAMDIPALIAPPLYWGIAADMAKYAGTFSIRPDTMKSLINDALYSLDKWGFKKVFIINVHGDPIHLKAINDSIKESNAALKMQTYHLGKDLDIEIDNIPGFPEARKGQFEPDIHAGSMETAWMNMFYPKRVNVKIAKTLAPRNSFHPMAYCGDPANFDLETRRDSFFTAALDADAQKIKKIVQK